MKLRSGNPALSEKTFQGLPRAHGEVMTLEGTVNKTAILLILTTMAAAFTWMNYMSSAGTSPLVGTLTITGALGGFVTALVTIFKKEWSAVTAPLYAGLEGLFLGSISAMMEVQYPGIVTQAVMLTFGTLGALLLAYRSGVIRATENFKLGLVAATGGVLVVYLMSFVLGFFGVSIPYIHGNGLVGIGFSVVVVVIAALNLVMDFDFIEQGAEQGAPKYMEWYGAFGLLVTLIWLYLELLRLLAKLQSRR